MEKQFITTLIEVLNYKHRPDLTELLKNSYGEIQESDQYGSYLFSTISKFLIFSPVEKYYKLKKISGEDFKLLLDSIIEIIPPDDNSPEIIDLDFRILPKIDDKEVANEKDYYLGEKIRIFLCYSTIDKLLAGEIREALENMGFEVFLAHEDIIPATEWREVILQNLLSTDIFIPLITKNFKNSDWADQECGIAFANKKFIIPIGIDGEIPYGFLDKYQVLRTRSGITDWSTPEIIEIIQKEKRFVNSLLNSLIKNFEASSSFADAGEKSKLFLVFDEIDKDQISRIIKATANNDQISHSWEAKANLKSLFKKHRASIDKVLFKDLKEEILDLFQNIDQK